jgi:hypothetical protein
MVATHQVLIRLQLQRLDPEAKLRLTDNYIVEVLVQALGAMPLLDPRCASRTTNPKSFHLLQLLHVLQQKI